MMKIQFDTNILLDILLPEREGAEASALLFEAARARFLTAYISAQSIVDAEYVCHRLPGFSSSSFKSAVTEILKFVNVDGVGYTDLCHAMEVDSDFEDAAQVAHAYRNYCRFFVTRDRQLLAGNSLYQFPCITPEDLLLRMK